MSASITKPDAALNSTSSRPLTDWEKQDQLEHISKAVTNYCTAGLLIQKTKKTETKKTEDTKRFMERFSSFEKQQKSRIAAWRKACRAYRDYYNEYCVRQNLVEDMKLLTLLDILLDRLQEMGGYGGPLDFPVSKVDIDRLSEVRNSLKPEDASETEGPSLSLGGGFWSSLRSSLRFPGNASTHTGSSNSTKVPMAGSSVESKATSMTPSSAGKKVSFAGIPQSGSSNTSTSK